MMRHHIAQKPSVATFLLEPQISQKNITVSTENLNPVLSVVLRILTKLLRLSQYAVTHFSSKHGSTIAQK